MLTTSNLCKTFGKLVAVNDLCMSVDRGDIMGFIGPNGAGKTTTIRMIATLLEPTSGTAYVDGIDVLEEPEIVRALIGYMPDFFGLYDDLLVWEYLDYFASAYKIPKPKRKQAINDVLELTDLTGKYDAQVESLSRGMKQRLCLAKTLLHDPKLLLLDEPASGLDPRARAEIKDILRELGRMGKTILISSHILPELADFCNKVAIIEQGKMVVSGPVDDIVEQVRSDRAVEIKVVENQQGVVELLRPMPGVAGVEIRDGAVHARLRNEAAQHEILEALVNGGFKVQSFTETELDLEDVFLKVTRGAVS